MVSWRSEAGARSVVRAPAGRRDVHVYHWSPLTSGSRSFAVWPLLLPFTLVNVAGWMAPPLPRTWRTTVHRVGAVWVGLATTCATVVWLLVAAMAVWHEVAAPKPPEPSELTVVDASYAPLTQSTEIEEPPRPPGNLTGWEFTGAAALAAVAMGALVLMATFTAKGFERFRPAGLGPERRWRWPWGANTSARLDDRHFYDNRIDHAGRWRIHVIVAFVTWVVVVGVVFSGGTEEAGHLVGRALITVGVLQGIGCLLLTIPALVPERGDKRRITRRLLAPATAILGFLILGGLVLSALIALTGVDEVPPGPFSVLYDCYGWAVLGGVFGAVACAVHAMLTPVPAEKGLARAQLPTFGSRMRARLATVLGGIDRMVTPLALAFVVAGTVAVARRWDKMLDDTWRLTPSPPVNIARSTFAFVLAFTILNLVKSRASFNALRRIGNVWDILTFWPRTYHPFAVRPYAERAVPELQEFLECGPRTDGLVVAAHSQGTVLAYAAVRPFITADGGCTLPPFALVTFGSPLRALYANVFPHYFDPVEFEATCRALGGRWVNEFRWTDHVGRAVFGTAKQVVDGVNEQQAGADRPMGDALGPDRKVNGHNDYWTEQDIRDAVTTGGAAIAAVMASTESGRSA